MPDVKKKLLFVALVTAGFGIANAANAANLHPATSVVSAEAGGKEAVPAVQTKNAKPSAAQKHAGAAAEKPARDGDVVTTTTTSDLSKIPLFQQAKPLGGYR